MAKRIMVGDVAVGGGAPVSIQSMTNTKTADWQATLAQSRELQRLGCDIIRFAVPDMESARAIEKIKNELSMPVVADIHFDYRLALTAAAAGIDKIRINPGNIGSPERVRAVANACRERGIPIRIGVNAGSVEKPLLEKYGSACPEAMVESAVGHCELLEDCGFTDIAVSMKGTGVQDTLACYREFAKRRDYPLHLGITHAGTLHMGTIKAACGLGALLAWGYGDTLRVSLAADPVEEVRAGLDILRAMGLRRDSIEWIVCPTCGRCRIDVITLAEELEKNLAHIRKPLKIAVMGCAVNGPGEAREADLGVAGGDGCGLIFRHGEILRKVPMEALAGELTQLAEELAK